jgi:signal transduction histidine kinase
VVYRCTVARVGLLGLLVALALLPASVIGGLAAILPTPTISLPAATPSIPGTGLLSPTPIPGISPSATPLLGTPDPASPTATPSLGAAGTTSGGSGGTGATPAPAAAAPNPVVVVDSVLHTVLGPVPSEVPVFPILLPLLAGLFLLLVSAVLAAYRRTQEAHRFARLERTKSDFLKLASHELRTPLTVLLGYVSMIRDGDIQPATPAFDRALPIIEDRLNQVNTIVEQMLEAARLEDGLDQLNLERFDLADLVSDSVLAIRAGAGSAHPVEFRESGGELPLNCDRARVAAIVDQLLDNAVKYSPEGTPVECSLTAQAGIAQMTVRDRGPGIPSEDLERVFSRFGRLVTRDNSHIPGAGLGLYLARENARRMGGDITVVSRPSRGSAFTLSLPLDPGPAPGTAPVKVPVGS